MAGSWTAAGASLSDGKHGLTVRHGAIQQSRFKVSFETSFLKLILFLISYAHMMYVIILPPPQPSLLPIRLQMTLFFSPTRPLLLSFFSFGLVF